MYCSHYIASLNCCEKESIIRMTKLLDMIWIIPEASPTAHILLDELLEFMTKAWTMGDKFL